MTKEHKQLYLNLLLGFKVVESSWISIQGVRYYKVSVTGPDSIPPHNTTIYLWNP